MGQHFVVRLENRPGELAHLCKALAARGIDIHHIASGGAGSYGFAFLETDDPVATDEVLASLGYPYLDGEPLVVECEDKAGGLAGVIEKLAEAGVNILAVMTVTRCSGKAELAISVDEPAKAREILHDHGMIAA